LRELDRREATTYQATPFAHGAQLQSEILSQGLSSLQIPAIPEAAGRSVWPLLHLNLAQDVLRHKGFCHAANSVLKV
jgi:hypothetical protein